MLDNLVCPISNVRIDRNVVRVNGFITTLLLLTYVLIGAPWIIIPIGLDYVLRAMMHGPTSPMAHLAAAVARGLRVPFRPMDKAPKVFASRIGVCFAMGAAILYFVAPTASRYLAGALAIFTMLESVFDFCVGCVVYTYLALPLYRARNAVKSIKLFQELDDPMLVAVADGFTTIDLPTGTRLVSEGEPGGEMFVVRQGQVEVFRHGKDGTDSVIATYGQGTYFGEMALLSGAPRNASVRSISPVTLLRLDKASFDDLLQRHSGMRAVLERTAATRLAAEASKGV